MKKILDKIITYFFILVLGCMWYWSTKYQIKPDSYRVVIYDIFGKESKIEDMRTDFKTKEVARSHIIEYRERFSQYDFSLEIDNPKMERRLSVKRLF